VTGRSWKCFESVHVSLKPILRTAIVCEGCTNPVANSSSIVKVVSTALVHCGGIFTELHLSLAALQASAQQKRNNLLGVAVKSAALLGVDELVPVRVVSIGSSLFSSPRFPRTPSSSLSWYRLIHANPPISKNQICTHFSMAHCMVSYAMSMGTAQ
jgi:hypothetical protein